MRILIQALQILTYREVKGWGDTAFDYKLTAAVLVVMAVMLSFVAGNRVPDFEDSDKRRGTILEVPDSRGRNGARTLLLDEGGEIRGYTVRAFTNGELEPFIGREVTLSTYEMSQLPFLRSSSVVAIQTEGRLLDKSRDMQRNSRRFRGGFVFFSRALLVVLVALYFGLVHKLHTGKIVVEGNEFVWRGSM